MIEPRLNPVITGREMLQGAEWLRDLGFMAGTCVGLVSYLRNRTSQNIPQLRQNLAFLLTVGSCLGTCLGPTATYLLAKRGFKFRDYSDGSAPETVVKIAACLLIGPLAMFHEQPLRSMRYNL